MRWLRAVLYVEAEQPTLTPQIEQELAPYRSDMRIFTLYGDAADTTTKATLWTQSYDEACSWAQERDSGQVLTITVDRAAVIVDITLLTPELAWEFESFSYETIIHPGHYDVSYATSWV